ncbi:acyl-CoA dehydrogenase family protein [Pseudomonas sp. R5(2019)]|uniref:acyl-CoA dehydrogenase family protein n=1 Tax=Pseudomonas sp. R5(2019) TaxID=2697566 RepID=UPI001412CD75|nr:acyl-CoA dehydrogenase family protein [Pseudomonas sp. R5(2019)]NBA93716.1 acyl-CoA dehydrogenase [Pseudomonas sp. R5(2019)]
MEFRFSDEQHLIRDSAAAFFSEVSSSTAVREAMASELGYDRTVWQRLCQELGCQAISIPEAYGGLGLGYVELAIVLEQMGRTLACSPFFATVCLAVPTLLLAADEPQKQRYLPAIAAGELTATLAYTGPQAARNGGQWGIESIGATCRPVAEGYQLEGCLRYVIDGHNADLLLIAARGELGVSLFALDADHPGIERRWLPGMDQTRRQGEIHLHQVIVPASQRLGSEGDAWPQLQQVIALAKVALAAEQLGVARRTLDMSVDYLQQREQFARPLAGFQALKHKAADMLLKCELTHAAVYYAACVAEQATPELEEAAAMAKATASDAAFFNAGSAIQLHGGVGFTWEYDVHLYFKRAKASELYLGNGAQQRELIARLLLD